MSNRVRTTSAPLIEQASSFKNKYQDTDAARSQINCDNISAMTISSSTVQNILLLTPDQEHNSTHHMNSSSWNPIQKLSQSVKRSPAQSTLDVRSVSRMNDNSDADLYENGIIYNNNNNIIREQPLLSKQQENENNLITEASVVASSLYSTLNDNAYYDNYDTQSTKQQMRRYWRQFVVYMIYNSIRFLVISVIIFIVNYNHHAHLQHFHESNDYTICCSCYNEAKSADFRIDWSMCYDICNGCDTCKYNKKHNSHCKPTLLDDIDGHDNDEQDCPPKLSITSFDAWTKDYRLYGILPVSAVGMYIIMMILASVVNEGRSLISSAVIFIFFNVVVSLICSYCLIKRYQYKLHSFGEYECYKDLLDESAEDVLTWMVYIVIIFVMIPFFLCCFRCIVLRKNSYKMRKMYSMAMRFMLVLAILGCVGFSFILSWTSFFIAGAYWNNENMYNAAMLIVGIDCFLLMSVFDLCLCCQFCREKVRILMALNSTPYVQNKKWNPEVTTDSINSVNSCEYVEYE